MNNNDFEASKAERDYINRRVEQMFDHPQDRRVVKDRRFMPRGERVLKPDWGAVTLYVCIGLLVACVWGYLL